MDMIILDFVFPLRFTNQTGSYYVTNLPPGTYRIEVEKLGFKVVIKADLILHVQDSVEVNFEMVLGYGERDGAGRDPRA
jgi:hypothetical protein